MTKVMMRGNPLTVNVRRQYETWPFPGRDFLSREGLLLVRCLQLWLPGKTAGSDRSSRIIDVGCGTGNTTIALARHFPTHQFTGVDFSRKSLRVAKQLQQAHNVQNVDFRYVDLRSDLSTLGEFRIVLCAGVLHHIENLCLAFRRVAKLVEPGGYLLVWLYGRHGRTLHHLNQSFVEMLASRVAHSRRLRVAKAFVKHLGDRFACGSGFYTPRGSASEGIRWLLLHPQWLADQMIPGFEQSVTFDEILALFEQNNLQFVKWLGVSPRLSRYTSSRLMLECYGKLSPHDRLIAIDLLLKPEYYFVAGRRKPNGKVSP